MKLIGKGMFTKAYLLESGRVRLESVDQVKECMSLGWFPDHRLFPTIERIDFDCGHDGHSVYEMDFYERPKSLKNTLSSRQYDLYNVLRGLTAYAQRSCDIYTEWHKAFDSIPARFKGEREALKEALDAMLNYSTAVRFEISPRNVAVKGGKLILLDCFFIKD